MKISQYVVLCFLLLPSILISQEKFDFYLSNKGNDAYPGTSNLLPKKSIAGIAPLLELRASTGKTVKVALKSGDVWEENLITSYPIDLNTYSGDTAKKDFAILDGAKEFGSGWTMDSGYQHTFRQAIPYTGFEGYGINDIGNYSFIYVFEIDRALEKTAPFTARRMLKFVYGPRAVENTKGSFYTPAGNKNPMPLYIHTSDESSPNGNPKYRYEVCVKDWAVNSTYEENNNFENLWVRGFGAGNGILPGGANSHYNKIVFGPGAAIHHLVVRSGTIDHSLFLPGPKNTNQFAVVFYDVEGLARHCTIKNTMFFDINSPVYAHTSEGTNYGAVEIDHAVGFADSVGAAGFMYTSNTDSVLLNNIYTDGYYSGYHYGNAKYASINNSWFKNVIFGIAYNSAGPPIVSTVKNVFIKTREKVSGSGFILQGKTNLTLSNSIIHISNHTEDGGPAGYFFNGAGENENKIAASGNIFICDVAPARYIIAANTNIGAGIGRSRDRWDNNVYILLKGQRILWTSTDSNGVNNYIQSFDEWKRMSGQDHNSLYFDLSNDIRGLKAIFADPDNGNYDLADTPEGRQVAALHAGMTDPLTCFLQRPTYEEAADLVRNNQVLSPNTCRNPCRQNTIRINSTYDVAVVNERQIESTWKVSEQQNIDHYEIQRSSNYSSLNKTIVVPVSTDSLYSFTDDVQPGISYRYNLVIIPKSGGKCSSDTRNIKTGDNKAFTIYPNPSSGKLSISMNGYVGRTSIIVSNSVGQIVLTKKIVSLYNILQLDISNQPKGMYLIKVETAKGAVVQKFSLQ